MAKLNLPKKTKINRKVLISILYHDKNRDLFNLFKKLNLVNNFDFIIILDGLNSIKNQKVILKKFKRIRIIKAKKKNNSLPKNRNLSIKQLNRKHFILLFLDSDITPERNLIKNHLKFHMQNKDVSVAGGVVVPSFEIKVKSFWEILDGCMSWFTSIHYGKNRIIKFPYHLPTCNMSIKTELFKKKIAFDETLKTGEDPNFCDDIRKAGKKIALISGARVIHEDRIKFKDFLNHQLIWGKHQYYTLYKKKFYSKKNKLLFFLNFLIFFPFVMPIINLIYSFLILIPWIKKKFIFLLLFPFVIIVYWLKGVVTYKEFFKDCKKEVIKLFKY